MRPPILTKYPVEQIVKSLKDSKESNVWVTRFIPQLLNKQKLHANAISLIKRISLFKIQPITNDDLNNLITRLNIRINRYKKLLFFMWIILFFSYQFFIYTDNYNTEIYNECIENTTRLTNNLNMCLNTIQEGGEPGTYVSVISNSEMKECFIPYRYYFQCFK